MTNTQELQGKISKSNHTRSDPESDPSLPSTILMNTPEARSVDQNAKKGNSFMLRIRLYFQRFEKTLVFYNLEARGIQRVESYDTHTPTWQSYLQCFTLWISMNLTAVVVTLGMLAPTVYALGFKDAVLCAVFGSLLGSIPVAYIATRGPMSGNRSLVFARYSMGWWPTKLIVVLNLIILLGYNLIDCVVVGQILSAVSPNGSLSVLVGIIIAAAISWGVSTFGISILHFYERYACILQVIVISILYGVSAKHFDITTSSVGDSRTIAGNRLSFFSLCLSAAITYSGIAADFFVYYSSTTPPIALFTLSLMGLSISFTMAIILGIGLASGISSTPSYATAYEAGQGALIVAGYSPLGSFGKFCSVLVALGLIANLVPATYSSGIDFQLLADWARKIPRFVWNTVGVIIYVVCALVGRNSLSEIFTNFLALTGYWAAIWIAITTEEHFFFRYLTGRGYIWDDWDSKERLPVGIAALIAFLVGWAGAILCMAQVWYVGPIAAKVGVYGADMGNYVGFAWTATVYPPLRWWELRRFNR